MANLDLEQTVLWDLKETVRISGEIISWVGSPDINSWRFPENKAVCVDSLVEFEDFSKKLKENSNDEAKERYLFLLELVYDRIIMFLELLCSFMENFPLSSPVLEQKNKHHLRRNHIPKSKLIKLKGSFGIAEPISELWARLQRIREFIIQHLGEIVRKNEESIPKNKVNFNKLHKIYRSSETQYNPLEIDHQDTLQSCGGCYLTRSILKDIINCLIGLPNYHVNENDNDITPGQHSLLAREQVRSELSVLNDWGAVSKLVKAASEDIHLLINKYLLLISCHSKQKHQIHYLEKNNETELNRLQSKSKEEITKLKQQLEDVNLKLKETEEKHQRMNDLMENINKQKSDFEKQLKSQELTHQMNTKAFQELEKEAKNREDILKNSIESMKNMLKKEQERAKNEEEKRVYSEQNNLKAIAELKQTLIEAQMKAKLWTEYQSMVELRNNIYTETDPDWVQSVNEAKIELSKLRAKHCSLLGEFNENRSFIKRLEKQLRESQERESLLIEYPDINGPIEFQVKGDPLSDMEGQIKANELRIKMLIDQNKRMERTILKLRNLSNKNKKNSN